MKPSLIALCALVALAGCTTPRERAAQQALDDRAQMGVTFEPEWFSENDILIKDVPPGSPGAAAGLMPLDRVVAFDNRKVTTIQSLNELELQEKHGATVPVTVIRSGAPIQLQVQLQ